MRGDAWVRFLEQINDDNVLVRVIDKFELATPKREDLSVYREILRKEFEEDTCFYCGKKLGKNIHVDHFIPWSFVKDDKLWNFVLSCARCNPLFLAQKSVDATEADKQVVTDLLDTLRANLDHCVGMAANMIGVKKNIIVVVAGPFQFAMINPVITKRSGAYQTEEGCLSLEGVRPCKRYQEIDHCNGIVV